MIQFFGVKIFTIIMQVRSGHEIEKSLFHPEVDNDYNIWDKEMAERHSDRFYIWEKDKLMVNI